MIIKNFEDWKILIDGNKVEEIKKEILNIIEEASTKESSDEEIKAISLITVRRRGGQNMFSWAVITKKYDIVDSILRLYYDNYHSNKNNDIKKKLFLDLFKNKDYYKNDALDYALQARDKDMIAIFLKNNFMTLLIGSEEQIAKVLSKMTPYIHNLLIQSIKKNRKKNENEDDFKKLSDIINYIIDEYLKNFDENQKNQCNNQCHELKRIFWANRPLQGTYAAGEQTLTSMVEYYEDYAMLDFINKGFKVS